MTRATIRPTVVAGVLRAPPSKSYTHRALVAGFLAHRPYRVLHPLDSEDTRATGRGLRALGSRISFARERWTISPGPARPRTALVRCGESGTTLRLLAALAAHGENRVRFEGSPRLADRPMRPLLEALRRGGARIEAPHRRSLPLSIQGPIRAGTYTVDASSSSQFTSALLLVLPTLNGASALRLTGERVSEPYVEATVAVIRAHGVALSGGGHRWTTPGGQVYRAPGFDVPGDASSAAYLWSAAAVTGGSVTVTGVDGRWPQADSAILEALRAAGATVRTSARGTEVSGPLSDGFDTDLTASPDLFPLLGALAATIPQRSLLRGARQVVFKESDRRTTTVALVRALGGEARSRRAGLEIRGTVRPRRLTLEALHDHRVVMSAATAALAADGPSRLADAAAVRKSFPEFWSSLRRLGVSVRLSR